MENAKKYSLAAVILGFLVLFYWSYFKPSPPVKQYELKQDEKQKVVIDTKKRTVAVVTKDGVKVKRGVRHAEVIEKKDGQTVVVAKEYGLCFEPGVGLGLGNGLGIVGDVQFAYLKDFGAFAGVAYYPRNHNVRGHLGLGYNLPFLSNTSVYIAVDTNKSPVVVLSVKF